MAEHTSINAALKESLGNLQSFAGPSEESKPDTLATVIDYKMVTFSLAGKDYAIDIMKVKEIAKAGRFTYVPNSLPFVLGVYNLRGEIIPIVDLRLFFNIEVPEREFDALENMLIVSIGDQMFGVVVDGIDKVVGIQKSTINPPHPLFGDINIKYIQGVVEVNNRLYILLDIERIFGAKQEKAEGDSADVSNVAVQTGQKKTAAQKIAESKSPEQPASAPKAEQKSAAPATPAPAPAPKKEEKKIDYSFIVSGLLNMRKFAVSPLNEKWMQERYDSWEKERGKDKVQLQTAADAEAFLKTFYSPNSGTWWSKEYAESISKALPDNSAKQIVVWNPGCGKGHETYSFACILKKRYPEAKFKIYAHEIDLLSISNAPLLSIPADVASGWMSPYLSKKANGDFTFSQEIRDSILFEYHDCANTNTLPPVDIVLVRDVLSFLPVASQQKLSVDFSEKLKGNGVVILGQNETFDGDSRWSAREVGSITVFGKK